MTSDEALKKFYANLIMVDGRSELTAQTYKTAAKEFLGYLERQNIDLQKVAVKDLLYYLAGRKTDGCSELTLAKDISALRALGAFLVLENVWTQNEALVLDRPKARRSLPRVLSVEQVDSLLASIDATNDLGIRDRALFELIYSCGLRISEAATLQVGNLHLNEMLLLVRGKGDKERKSGLKNICIKSGRVWSEKKLFRPFLSTTRASRFPAREFGNALKSLKP